MADLDLFANLREKLRNRSGWIMSFRGFELGRVFRVEMLEKAWFVGLTTSAALALIRPFVP